MKKYAFLNGLIIASLAVTPLSAYDDSDESEQQENVELLEKEDMHEDGPAQGGDFRTATSENGVFVKDPSSGKMVDVWTDTGRQIARDPAETASMSSATLKYRIQWFDDVINDHKKKIKEDTEGMRKAMRSEMDIYEMRAVNQRTINGLEIRKQIYENTLRDRKE